MKYFLLTLLMLVCFSSQSSAQCCYNRCGVVKKAANVTCRTVVRVCHVPVNIIENKPVRTFVENKRCQNGQCSNPRVINHGVNSDGSSSLFLNTPKKD